MSTIVSANEAVHRFDLSEKTVRRWIASGKLKADKRGRSYRVDVSEVAALTGHNTTHDRGPSADTVQKADTGSAPNTADSTSEMSGITALVALVDRLQIENRDLAARSPRADSHDHVGCPAVPTAILASDRRRDRAGRGRRRGLG
jgi:excisionase family DNA binding protein